MANHVGTPFTDAREIIDGNHYERCVFVRCTIVYQGGELPKLIGCQFDECNWVFEDAADRTLRLLSALYHGLGPGGRKLVDKTFTSLKSAGPKGPKTSKKVKP